MEYLPGWTGPSPKRRPSWGRPHLPARAGWASKRPRPGSDSKVYLESATGSVFTIGQAARVSGLSPGTVRYYEREAVLPRAPAARISYRGYPAEHVETLRFAQRLREPGLAQAAMADLVRLFHVDACQQMDDALIESCGESLNGVQTRRLELERVEAQLTLRSPATFSVRPVAPDEVARDERQRGPTPVLCLVATCMPCLICRGARPVVGLASSISMPLP
jgi:DNA-binding transcriptional MerR regulator